MKGKTRNRGRFKSVAPMTNYLVKGRIGKLGVVDDTDFRFKKKRTCTVKWNRSCLQTTVLYPAIFSNTIYFSILDITHY